MRPDFGLGAFPSPTREKRKNCGVAPSSASRAGIRLGPASEIDTMAPPSNSAQTRPTVAEARVGLGPSDSRGAPVDTRSVRAPFALNKRHLALSPALALLVATIAAAQSPSNTPRPELWVVDGFVNSIIESCGTLYLGGAFSNVSKDTGAFA